MENRRRMVSVQFLTSCSHLFVALDQIAATWDVPALQFNWKGLRMTTISYSLDRCNPYVRRLNVECSTMTLEWMADLLNSLDEVLPSVISVNIRYHHLILPPEQHRLLPCFLREHHSNEKFVEFVSSLKTDQLSMQEFISCFIEFVSGKTRKQAQFVVNIVCPINYCRLTSSTVIAFIIFSCFPCSRRSHATYFLAKLST